MLAESVNVAHLARGALKKDVQPAIIVNIADQHGTIGQVLHGQVAHRAHGKSPGLSGVAHIDGHVGR